MLLRNYYNAIAATFLSHVARNAASSYYTNDPFEDGYLTIKGYDGNKFYKDVINEYDVSLANIGHVNGSSTLPSASYPSIWFGTGSTAVTFDDYALANRITTLNVSSFQHSVATYSSATNSYESTMSCILSNGSASDITVSEVGLGVRFTRYGSTQKSDVLIYREVLATPFTVAANDAVRYTHTFNFTMPTLQ